MPRYAAISQDATARLRELAGSSSLDCYTYIDPEHSGDSFFVVRFAQRVVHVTFSELSYDPGSFPSLIEALYKSIYES